MSVFTCPRALVAGPAAADDHSDTTRIHADPRSDPTSPALSIVLGYN